MPQPAQPDPTAENPRPTTPPATESAATSPSGGGVLKDRGSGFRPYPTASTSTRLSPASPASRAASSKRRPRVGSPIPATVWVPEPGQVVDPAAVWPAVVLRQIVSAFSRPGDEVVLTSWPSDTTAAPIDDRTPAGGAPWDGSTHGASARGASGGDLDGALDTVARLHRCPRVVELGSDHPINTLARGPIEFRPSDDEAGVVSRGGTTELVVTSMPPNPAATRHVDAIALHAARELRFGGILVVLTHCYLDGGELRDPTGPMIAAAQNADLLYLQHIVAVHLPVHDLRAATTNPDPTAAPPAAGSDAPGSDGAGPGCVCSQPARSGGAHPDGCGGASHRRVHSDVLAFSQPHSSGSSGELKGLHGEPEERSGVPGGVGAGVPGDPGAAGLGGSASSSRAERA